MLEQNVTESKKLFIQTQQGINKLIAAQTTAFFENADQMGIPNETVVQIQQKGIDNVDNLVDFNKDTIEQIAANL